MAKNILVGDIGSTKSVWLKNFGAASQVALRGYNPIVHNAAEGRRMFVDLATALEGTTPDLIYYFGTGIIDRVTEQTITTLAKEFFPLATLYIESDMVGACRSACGTKPGTVAILGTGSNCAVFDGADIIRKATTLGYMLGDEGSGSDIGKNLAKAYFYQTMPNHVREQLDPFFQNDRISFLHYLYTSSTPNQFLADSVKGISDLQHDPWVEAVLRNCFATFINTHVIPLLPVGPVHIIGSIGYIFSDLIVHELTNAGLTPGKIIRDPVQQLFETLIHDTTA